MVISRAEDMLKIQELIAVQIQLTENMRSFF